MSAEHNYQATTGNTNGQTMEKDFSKNGYQNGYNSNANHLHGDMEPNDALRRIQTSGSISISPELFEKIYLSPQNQVKGELRKTLGNPTPLALIGFLIVLSPLSCDLMNWRGAAGGAAVGAAGTGTYYFFGGLLLILGALGEFLVGNTFPFVVFGSFGAFWLSFAATLQPLYNAYGAYSPDPTNPAAGLNTVAFHSSYAFFFIAMGLMCFIYMILSLRTNIAFFIIFFTLVLAFGFLAGAYFQISNGNLALAGRLQTAAGAFTFVTCASGWWIFFAIMLAALDFPFQLPVGDLSGLIKGASDRKKAAEHKV
ncbi:putative gpr1 fun34-class plasma membrane protein [Venturia nashicola]|uniref:Putative gpr1 fun34-class plasma membrane protein n=1 Tax=Venturia nashicola TaxID=86259 RepID=A0A4Z1PMP7_9PEZI|nr:putative gpr1 fun34-class plasma membrane protein [Venturia nashicola]TLD36440.1 putative gpr1 fun34-class plasma membrane protein [Venturia nashicola]